MTPASAVTFDPGDPGASADPLMAELERVVAATIAAERGRLERDLALAVALTPVEFRHRITVVSVVGEMNLGHVACLLPS